MRLVMVRVSVKPLRHFTYMVVLGLVILILIMLIISGLEGILQTGALITRQLNIIPGIFIGEVPL